ncbi:MAG: Maf family protein [Gemmatimonadota bacterium]
MSDPFAPRLVLASGSPRRRDLLAGLGLAFEVDPPRNPEEVWDGRDAPDAFARRLAEAKAADVAGRRPGDLVIGADTIVVLGSDVLGKPADSAAARTMLQRLSGLVHAVHTGVAVVLDDRRASGVEVTAVRFRDLGATEIDDYVATGEPLDKAGAYGIQAFGATLVERVEGCYFNVMGLPVVRLLALLEEVGWEYRVPGRLHRVGLTVRDPDGSAVRRRVGGGDEAC